MFRSLLPEIQGLATLKVVSLLIFLIIFAAAIIVVFRMTRQHIRYMENLPLDDNEFESQQFGENTHG